MADETGMAERLDNVGLGDPKVEITSFDRYKGRKNVTDRITILSASLLRARTHFIGPSKKTFKCISTPVSQGICCRTMGEPEQKFGLTLFQYTTNENGELLVDNKLSGKVKIWVITESRYQELSGINKEWPLMNGGFQSPQVDLSVKCTEEQYQRMQFTVTKEAFWKKKEDWYNALMQKEMKARSKMTKVMGNDWNELEIMEALKIDPNPGRPPTAGDSVDIDMEDVLGPEV